MSERKPTAKGTAVYECFEDYVDTWQLKNGEWQYIGYTKARKNGRIDNEYLYFKLYKDEYRQKLKKNF